MKLPFRFFAPLALVVLCFLTACDDPSNVGIGLVGDQGGTPSLVTSLPDTFGVVASRDVSGNNSRFLAGTVDDPMFGRIEAKGYLDFDGVGNLTSAFKAGPITSVELRLYPSYRYGDTTGTVTLRVSDMTANWSATNAPVDTTLGVVGAEATRVTFTPRDTLVVVPMPADWIARNDTTLRSVNFATSFNGFELSGAAGNAVMGFTAAEARLRVVSGADTVDFPVATVAYSGTTTILKTLTTVQRTGQQNLPPGTVPLQDSFGKGIAFRFDLKKPELARRAINRALFSMQADTVSLKNTPAGFVRPTMTDFTLLGIRTDGKTVYLDAFRINSTASLSLGSSVFSQVMQRLSLQDPNAPYARLVLTPMLGGTNTLDAMLFYGPDASQNPPTATFTVTPLD